MTSETESAPDLAAAKRPSGYLRVFILAGSLIVAGLSVISVRVAIVLAAVLLPALAVAVGMISRVDAWRPVLLKVWPFTALAIALLFLMPGHVIYRLATTPDATFKRLIVNPIPDGVSGLEKKESRGFENWVSLTFDARQSAVDAILASRPYQLQVSPRLRLGELAGRINVGNAAIYEADYPEHGIRFTAIVERRTDRMCVVYERY